jgi:hypothetical protein
MGLHADAVERDVTLPTDDRIAQRPGTTTLAALRFLIVHGQVSGWPRRGRRRREQPARRDAMLLARTRGAHRACGCRRRKPLQVG